MGTTVKEFEYAVIYCPERPAVIICKTHLENGDIGGMFTISKWNPKAYKLIGLFESENGCIDKGNAVAERLARRHGIEIHQYFDCKIMIKPHKLSTSDKIIIGIGSFIGTVAVFVHLYIWFIHG
jgi:hypothetical protein